MTPKKLCYFCYACATVRITCYASTTTLLIVSSFVRDRQYVHDIAYAMQCVLCYCCVCQPSPSNDCTSQPSPSNGCAQQHMFCFDMLLVLLALQSLALYTTCAVITARANARGLPFRVGCLAPVVLGIAKLYSVTSAGP